MLIGAKWSHRPGCIAKLINTFGETLAVIHSPEIGRHRLLNTDEVYSSLYDAKLAAERYAGLRST